MRPPFSLFLSRSCSPFFFLDLLDFFSLTLLELEDVEDEPAGEEDTEECFTLSVRLVAEMAEETEEALEVVEAGEPGREVEAARLAGRAVTVGTEVGGACSAPESIFDSEESSGGNFRAWKEFYGKSGSTRNSIVDQIRGTGTNDVSREREGVSQILTKGREIH